MQLYIHTAQKSSILCSMYILMRKRTFFCHLHIIPQALTFSFWCLSHRVSRCGVPCKYASLLMFCAPCIWIFLLCHPNFDFLRDHQPLMAKQKVVTPVKTGVQSIYKPLKRLDSGFRRNDGKQHFKIFCEIINP